jgi:putative chitinase
MTCTITGAQISQLTPNTPGPDAIAAAINSTAQYYGIADTALRMRYFIAQSCFETQNYSFWSENLNYTTPERLVAVWPSRFTTDPTHTAYALAQNYVNNPQKLANLVYANRGGNGDPTTGDGFAFRGRGAFHLTFRSNYAAYSQARYGDNRIVQNPDMVAQPTDAFMSAGWFWSTNGLSTLADADQFTRATQVINGSTVTVPQRLITLNQVNAIFQW